MTDKEKIELAIVQLSKLKRMVGLFTKTEIDNVITKLKTKYEQPVNSTH